MSHSGQCFDRRTVLAWIGSAVVALAAAPACAAPFFKRHGLRLGVQLYTVRTDAGKNLEGVLKTLAAMGYGTIELAGLLGRTPREMRTALDQAGLQCPSAHFQPRARGNDLSFDGDLGKLAEALHVIGADTAIVPIPYIPDRLLPKSPDGRALPGILAQMTADDWKRTADFLNMKAQGLRPRGIKVGYHNHNAEFAPLGGTSGMQILLKSTDPDLVTFELDAGWVAAAGADPFKLLAEHSGRFSLMHVKDIKASTKPNFELRQASTEVGGGIIDWSRLLPFAYDAGVRHFFVEQEPPFERSRLEAVRSSYDFLMGLDP